jgi:hypothetical protein
VHAGLDRRVQHRREPPRCRHSDARLSRSAGGPNRNRPYLIY